MVPSCLLIRLKWMQSKTTTKTQEEETKDCTWMTHQRKKEKRNHSKVIRCNIYIENEIRKRDKNLNLLIFSTYFSVYYTNRSVWDVWWANQNSIIHHISICLHQNVNWFSSFGSEIFLSIKQYYSHIFFPTIILV